MSLLYKNRRLKRLNGRYSIKCLYFNKKLVPKNIQNCKNGGNEWCKLSFSKVNNIETTKKIGVFKVSYHEQTRQVDTINYS